MTQGKVWSEIENSWTIDPMGQVDFGERMEDESEHYV
jgi:hypothetical protein